MMLRAPTPINERQRLETIEELGLLQSNHAFGFDKITHVASKLLDVPIAMVNIISKDKEVNKSCYGMIRGQTRDRNSCLCSFTIMSDEPFIIEDIWSDERFNQLPDIKDGPRIRAYAGIPLKAPDGTHPGALCVMDMNARTFSYEDIELLEDLASWAELECRKNT